MRARSGRGEVPVGPLREAFVRSGMTFGEVARRIGVDQSHVARMLGDRAAYSDQINKAGVKVRYRYKRQTVAYENAVKLAHALGVDPVDVGC